MVQRGSLKSSHMTRNINILCIYVASYTCILTSNELCGRLPRYAPAPCKLTFGLLTLKLVSKSRVMWATSVPILVFLGLSVLDLAPMYATDRQTSDRQMSDVRYASSLNASALWGAEA